MVRFLLAYRVEVFPITIYLSFTRARRRSPQTLKYPGQREMFGTKVVTPSPVNDVKKTHSHPTGRAFLSLAPFWSTACPHSKNQFGKSKQA